MYIPIHTHEQRTFLAYQPSPWGSELLVLVKNAALRPMSTLSCVMSNKCFQLAESPSTDSLPKTANIKIMRKNQTRAPFVVFTIAPRHTPPHHNIIPPLHQHTTDPSLASRRCAHRALSTKQQFNHVTLTKNKIPSAPPSPFMSYSCLFVTFSSPLLFKHLPTSHWVHTSLHSDYSLLTIVSQIPPSTHHPL